MKRIIRKSLIFFALLVVIMLSSVFLLPSMLFADTYIFDAIGDDNYPGVSVTTGDSVLFHFDVSGVSLSSITSAILAIEGWDVNYPSEIDEVYFEGHDLGPMSTPSPGGTWAFSYFTIDPSWIKNGRNDARIDASIDGGFWTMAARNATLTIEGKKKKAAVEEEKVWVRDVDMTCYQVWINEDNNFEFVFWYEYENNNWVKIYDMAGIEVFSIDMPNGAANFEAVLPDGMYTVKTFHNGMETPIQEFIIGKP
ncbi:T9SS type A sorting domain-containing protein [Actinomycetota bacterium]